MSARCDAELCPFWTGQGCACEVMGIDPPGAVDAYGDPLEDDEDDR